VHLVGFIIKKNERSVKLPLRVLKSNEKVLKDKNAHTVSACIGKFTVSLCQNNTLAVIMSS